MATAAPYNLDQAMNKRARLCEGDHNFPNSPRIYTFSLHPADLRNGHASAPRSGRGWYGIVVQGIVVQR